MAGLVGGTLGDWVRSKLVMLTPLLHHVPLHGLCMQDRILLLYLVNEIVKIYFTITAEIHACSLANFYCQYADRHTNLKSMRCVSERELAFRQFAIVKNKLMSVFNASVLLLIMNFHTVKVAVDPRRDTLKTDVNSLNMKTVKKESNKHFDYPIIITKSTTRTRMNISEFGVW